MNIFKYKSIMANILYFLKHRTSEWLLIDYTAIISFYL